MITRLTEDGTVIGREVTREPVPGNHVSLTLDLDLQIVTEHALSTHIDRVNITREQLRLSSDDEDEEDNTIRGGAVVVTNVNTGEVLASATYPTFNLQTLSEDWLFLNTNPNNPMLNRATHGRYIPGSTFKMVTALAGLRHIPRFANNKYYQIYDEGSFTRYIDADGFVANCWIFNQQRVTHGWVNLTQALECSCNYYFIQMADWLPGSAREKSDLLAEAAMDFGLGLRTGLEISDSAGRLPTQEARYAATGYERWYFADNIMAGFGQGESRFTPVQLANYAATIANGGTLYSLTILRMVRNPGFTEVLRTTEPRVLNVIEETEFIEWIQEGMVLASTGRNGTARRIFRDFPIVVASKTGTVQIEGRAFNDGVFVCYAPADNPQIAISIVVEKGGSGSEVMGIAETILRHYFLTQSSFMAVPYGGLVP
jgi:penicillin-binding protein 2